MIQYLKSKSSDAIKIWRTDHVHLGTGMARHQDRTIRSECWMIQSANAVQVVKLNRLPFRRLLRIDL